MKRCFATGVNADHPSSFIITTFKYFFVPVSGSTSGLILMSEGSGEDNIIDVRDDYCDVFKSELPFPFCLLGLSDFACDRFAYVIA